MGIFADVAGTGHTILFTFFGDRLCDSQNVSLIEAVTARATAMAGSAKFHRMFCVTQFRLQDIILRC
ncbi:hypothetical protein D3C86_2170010 [compost metagenome]